MYSVKCQVEKKRGVKNMMSTTVDCPHFEYPNVYQPRLQKKRLVKDS